MAESANSEPLNERHQREKLNSCIDSHRPPPYTERPQSDQQSLPSITRRTPETAPTEPARPTTGGPMTLEGDNEERKRGYLYVQLPKHQLFICLGGLCTIILALYLASHSDVTLGKAMNMSSIAMETFYTRFFRVENDTEKVQSIDYNEKNRPHKIKREKTWVVEFSPLKERTNEEQKDHDSQYKRALQLIDKGRITLGNSIYSCDVSLGIPIDNKEDNIWKRTVKNVQKELGLSEETANKIEDGQHLVEGHGKEIEQFSEAQGSRRIFGRYMVTPHGPHHIDFIHAMVSWEIKNMPRITGHQQDDGANVDDENVDLAMKAYFEEEGIAKMKQRCQDLTSLLRDNEKTTSKDRQEQNATE